MRHLLPLAVLGIPSLALAVDADPFDPSGSVVYGQGTLQGESPVVEGEGPSVGVLASITEDLVVRRTDSGEAPLLATTLATNVQASWAMHEKFRVDLFLPFYPYAEVWDAPRLGLEEYQGLAMGDVRVRGVVPFFAVDSGALSLAGVAGIGLPTGMDRALVGRGFHAQVALAAGGELDAGLGYLANVGATLAPGDELGGVSLGSTFDLLGGLWFRTHDNFRIGGEAQMLAGLANATGVRNDVVTGHLFFQTLAESGVSMTIGAGSGMLDVGAPDWRVFAAMAWAPVNRDKDADGITDDEDACIVDAEDIDGFEDLDGCPDLDNDLDGIADLADSCPEDPEDLDDYADSDGCPEPDNDDDGVLDGDDLCPLEPGTAAGCPDMDADGLADADDRCPTHAGDEAHGGCPDADDDGVIDPDDLCPTEARPADETLEWSDGCPKTTYFAADALVMAEPVLYTSGRSSLTTAQRVLLDPVADLIEKSEHLVRLEVGGHTDAREGNAEGVSAARADKVVAHLKLLGVDEGLLVARAYAAGQPADTNRTATGRANNRRVTFKVLEQQAAIAVDEVPAPEPETREVPVEVDEPAAGVGEAPWVEPEPATPEPEPAAPGEGTPDLVVPPPADPWDVPWLEDDVEEAPAADEGKKKRKKKKKKKKKKGQAEEAAPEVEPGPQPDAPAPEPAAPEEPEPATPADETAPWDEDGGGTDNPWE